MEPPGQEEAGKTKTVMETYVDEGTGERRKPGAVKSYGEDQMPLDEKIRLRQDNYFNCTFWV